MNKADYYIGLISGTSVDGVDCVLVQFAEPQLEQQLPKLIATHFVKIDSNLRTKILGLCSGTQINLENLGRTDVEIGQLFATTVNELLQESTIDKSAIRAIGSHGQTVHHQPSGDYPYTLQIGDPNSIAQLTGISTVADFRRRDIAAGGEGAPLAPLLHRNCFSSSSEDRVVINIGGISNITILKRDGNCAAFDTGPGNVLLDYWIDKHQQHRFDENGDWARTGTVNSALLKLLQSEKYFTLAHPKSTGRELFNGPWLETKLDQISEKLAAADVQATLVALTVNTLTSEIKRTGVPQRAFVCGGGAHNAVLMESLQLALGECTVDTTSAIGLDPDWVEAVAFAWMAQQTIEGKAIDTRPFTGAKEAIILGGIYQA